MGMIEGRVRRSRGQWQALIERAELSALSIEAFCRAEGISTASFYSWRKRLASEQAPAAAPAAGDSAGPFIDLGALGCGTPCAARGWDIELQLGTDVVLRLRHS